MWPCVMCNTIQKATQKDLSTRLTWSLRPGDWECDWELWSNVWPWYLHVLSQRLSVEKMGHWEKGWAFIMMQDSWNKKVYFVKNGCGMLRECHWWREGYKRWSNSKTAHSKKEAQPKNLPTLTWTPPLENNSPLLYSNDFCSCCSTKGKTRMIITGYVSKNNACGAFAYITVFSSCPFLAKRSWWASIATHACAEAT